MKIKKITRQNRRDFYAIYECECCGRQLSIDPWDTKLQAPGPFTRLFSDQYVCGDCSIDLDENGNFPEEY